jgi:glycosyltransferase involved in cell wall biosynthesis
MRVTHVITRLIIGGAQENTIASVLGLRQKPGLEVDLISGPTRGPEGSLERGLQEIPGLLQIVPQLVRPVHPWHDWVALCRLQRIFRQRPPDIVHTHSGKAGVLGRIAAARAGVPVIIHTIHGPSFGPFQGFLPNLVFRSAERYAAKVTSHFVVVADAMKEQYLAAGIGRPDQYTRVFSGFDLEPFLSTTNAPQLRAKLGITPSDLVVGKIARLFQHKGHEELLAIAPAIIRSCPQVKFLLVGDGKYRQRLEHQVQANGLAKHFVFAGLVPPSTIASLVGIMDVLVHLSVREGLARALPQALAAGRPVIAYDCDGAKEVCLDNQTGFLVSRGDRAVLTERLLALLRQPALRTRFGEAGRDFVRRSFSVQQMVDDLHAIYLRLNRNQNKPSNLAAA